MPNVKSTTKKVKRRIIEKVQRDETFFKDVPTLSGVKRYEFEALQKREAMFIAHNSLRIILSALGNVSSLLCRKIEEEDTETRAQILKGVVEGLSIIDFDTIWDLARSIFRNVAIDGEILIEDIDESNYFPENLDEFYMALIIGIGGNFPNVFTKIQGALSGLDLSKNLGSLKDLLDSSES